MPRAVLEAATGTSRVRPIPVSTSDADASERPGTLGGPRIAHLVDRLSALLEASCSPASPVRICVPALGSPQWGDLEAQVRCDSVRDASKYSRAIYFYSSLSSTSSLYARARQDILRFLHSLRALLRRHPSACAAIALPPDISADGWGGPGWVQKLGWLSDASIALAAFTGAHAPQPPFF